MIKFRKLPDFKFKTQKPSYYSDWVKVLKRPSTEGIRQPINSQTVEKRLQEMQRKQNRLRNATKVVSPIKPLKPITTLKSNY